MGLGKFRTLLALCFFVTNLSFVASIPAYAGTTKSRYQDYYRWKSNEERRQQRINQKAKAHRQARKKEAERLERIRKNYSKAQRKKQKLNLDKKAESWMKKRNQAHQNSLNQARARYIKNRKKYYKYKIPENEEYEIDTDYREKIKTN